MADASLLHSVSSRPTELRNSQLKEMFPTLWVWTLVPLIPYIIVEQLRPVGEAPRWQDYGSNILISLSTAYLSLSLGIAAGLWSAQLRELLAWKTLSFTFASLESVSLVGPLLCWTGLSSLRRSTAYIIPLIRCTTTGILPMRCRSSTSCSVPTTVRRLRSSRPPARRGVPCTPDDLVGAVRSGVGRDTHAVATASHLTSAQVVCSASCRRPARKISATSPQLVATATSVAMKLPVTSRKTPAPSGSRKLIGTANGP